MKSGRVDGHGDVEWEDHQSHGRPHMTHMTVEAGGKECADIVAMAVGSCNYRLLRWHWGHEITDGTAGSRIVSTGNALYTHKVWCHEPTDGTSCTHERCSPHHLQFLLPHFQDSVPERIFPRIQFQHLEWEEGGKQIVVHSFQ